MRTRLGVVSAAVALLMVGTAVVAWGDPAPKVTGGGQTLVGTTGAGNTIAFHAQGAGVDTKGQLQFVDRSAGNGQSQIVLHGDVLCLEISGNTARFEGVWSNDGGAFEVLAQDNGEPNQGNDQIAMETMGTFNCTQDQVDEDDFVDFARGNVQVHNR